MCPGSAASDLEVLESCGGSLRGSCHGSRYKAFQGRLVVGPHGASGVILEFQPHFTDEETEAWSSDSLCRGM